MSTFISVSEKELTGSFLLPEFLPIIAPEDAVPTQTKIVYKSPTWAFPSPSIVSLLFVLLALLGGKSL
jgi:hypothetical protein